MTIKDIDQDLLLAIQRIAREEGESTGKVVQKLLRKALTLNDSAKPKRDLTQFYGVWSKEDAQEFKEAVKIFEQI